MFALYQSGSDGGRLSAIGRKAHDNSYCSAMNTFTHECLRVRCGSLSQVVIASSIFKGVAGAQIESVHATDVILRVQTPHTPPPPSPDHHGKHPAARHHQPEFLFQCEGFTSAPGIVFERLNISWEGRARNEWTGVQNGTCVTLIVEEERK
jgi:hypothetical protein